MMALHKTGIVWAMSVEFEGRVANKESNCRIGLFGPDEKDGHLWAWAWLLGVYQCFIDIRLNIPTGGVSN